MRPIRTWALLMFGSAFVLTAAERLVVHRAELAGPLGTDAGHLVLTGDQLVFVDDSNADGSFTIPKADIRALHLEHGLLTLSLNRPFVNMFGQRQDAVIRLADPDSPSMVATWVGLPLAGEPSTGVSDRFASFPPDQLQFDVKHDDDTGRVIAGASGIGFEALSNAKKSRMWSYAAIKEFKREKDREFKLKTYEGEEFKFKLLSHDMSREVYDLIADRIIGSRRPQ